jgi:hypothetical protein
MCIIEKVTAYRVDGKLHATELEAVRSAIKDIGDKLIKNNHANIGEGIIGHADVLLDMLSRYKRLAPAIATTEAPEKLQEDPSNG